MVLSRNPGFLTEKEIYRKKLKKFYFLRKKACNFRKIPV